MTRRGLEIRMLRKWKSCNGLKQVGGTIGTGGNVTVGEEKEGGVGTAGAPRVRAAYSVNALADLIAQFQQGLYFPHHTWLEPMRDISIKCWDLTRGTSENTAVVNIAGFLILPGLISVMRKMKGGQSPVDFLKDTAKKNYPGKEIVRKARLVQSELEAEKQRRASREYQAPTLDSLVKQVDKCIDEDRLSAAAGVVSRIHEQMEGVQPQVPLTPDQIREKIASLHPEQDEEDILPEDKSEDPAGIQVDEADVWVWVRKLNVKSGTGISGWTNRLIRAMMTRATGDRGVAQDKLNKARIAFANFINAVLDGSMSEKVASGPDGFDAHCVDSQGRGWMEAFRYRRGLV